MFVVILAFAYLNVFSLVKCSCSSICLTIGVFMKSLYHNRLHVECGPQAITCQCHTCKLNFDIK